MSIGVFPTRVGMNRLEHDQPGSYHRVPHTRGDEPVKRFSLSHARWCSPHAWG